MNEYINKYKGDPSEENFKEIYLCGVRCHAQMTSLKIHKEKSKYYDFLVNKGETIGECVKRLGEIAEECFDFCETNKALSIKLGAE
ncbi:MAG: hypothetical protein ACFFCW_41455 [Candidatus Hodarchaeota archaeon]